MVIIGLCYYSCLLNLLFLFVFIVVFCCALGVCCYFLESCLFYAMILLFVVIIIIVSLISLPFLYGHAGPPDDRTAVDSFLCGHAG